MKVTVFIIILLFTTILNSNANGYITIEIEPDDVYQLSNILQTFLENNQIPTTRTRSSIRHIILPLIKSFSRGIIQMLSIMLTLVGANLITMKMESSVVIVNQTEQTTTHEICKHDFGCTENICWRTCEETNDKKEEQKFCFTSPYSNMTNFHPCTFTHECSPCWKCTTACTDGRVF